MLIFWEKRLVFLATPKAGSTAIESALEPLANVAVQRPAELKHANLRTYRQHVEPWLHSVTGEKFLTIALMREPIEWLRSWYRFRLRDDVEDPSHAMIGLSFADFAQAYTDPEGPEIAHVGAQADFLTTEADRVDCIFRYENMDTFTHFLEDRLDCAISLPRVNVPPAVDVSLDAQQETVLRNIMAQDFSLYDSL
ncbi:sulfotransferase family 2 domain-containing protein [Paracoccus methylovorus]|uniref:Sulfotransferase family 2 domain-containing protein n=1 Tax=Paracoccus methylovorus TaxID=2812658 RepID=A0ABX7JKP4_9RHOB|nr:sulfotransferase family 2 domain-containing protein [Paracoccus methylovorus]QRZ14116.1 sulfotransferase family 2 domain-containing protein [Paracoccus methylovorus]